MDAFTFPDQAIDPRKKDYNWILQFLKAAWHESKGKLSNSLYFGMSRYSEIRMYAQGRQSTDKYKKLLAGEDLNDESWLAIDWSPLALLPKYREIAVSKILEKQYDIQAYAVDALSKSEEDKYFNEMKIKIMMREAAAQQGSELAGNPLLQPAPNEPQDEEQLKIEMDYGYKHVLAMEAEMGIELIMQQNDKDELRRRVVEGQVDFGLGGYTTWIDENGMCKYREVAAENLVTSFCVKPDFSDMSYWGEVIEVLLSDLVPYFTKDQIEKIGNLNKGKNGNPKTFVGDGKNCNIGRFKVLVFDAKFLSWNESVYKEEIDSRGNERFGKTHFNNKQFVGGTGIEDIEAEYNAPIEETGDEGAAQPKYLSNTRKVVYKGKWIIDTDMMYDWGLSENMVRKQSCWWDTSLDIQLFSWNFYRMSFSGITERLIPLEDKACLLWYKMQNLANKLIPYIINLDLNAFEGLNFGKGGEKFSPRQAVDFLFQNFVAVYRSTDLLAQNPNYKPVSIEATGQLAVFGQYREELFSTIEMMKQVSGLNDATDSSTVGQKTLNGATQAMIESTNNALRPIMKADRYLLLKLADNIIQKIQIAVKLGKVEGYVRALGRETMQFLSISPDISLREFGIYLQDAPTEMQREMLWQECNAKESMGMLDVTDKALIMSCRNIKQAIMVLGYRIKKRTEEAHQRKLEEIQATSQSQAEGAAMIEQAKQSTIAMQGELDIQKVIIEKQLEFEIEKMKKSIDYEGEALQVHGRTIGHDIQAQAKVIAAKISADSAERKQAIANKKKPTSTKK